jgi:hypothetical protein
MRKNSNKLPAVMSNPVPDMAECVKYQGNLWRVCAWFKLVKKRNLDTSTDFIDKIMNKILLEDPYQCHYRLEPCLRDEADAIEIYAVCGAIVRIADVKRTGFYVDWSLEDINEERGRAVNRATDRDKAFHGIGNGYHDLLERLFPERDILEYGYNRE